MSQSFNLHKEQSVKSPPLWLFVGSEQWLNTQLKKKHQLYLAFSSVLLKQTISSVLFTELQRSCQVYIFQHNQPSSSPLFPVFMLSYRCSFIQTCYVTEMKRNKHKQTISLSYLNINNWDLKWERATFVRFDNRHNKEHEIPLGCQGIDSYCILFDLSMITLWFLFSTHLFSLSLILPGAVELQS